MLAQNADTPFLGRLINMARLAPSAPSSDAHHLQCHAPTTASNANAKCGMIPLRLYLCVQYVHLIDIHRCWLALSLLCPTVHYIGAGRWARISLRVIRATRTWGKGERGDRAMFESRLLTSEPRPVRRIQSHLEID